MTIQKELAEAFPQFDISHMLGLAQVTYTSCYGSSIIFGIYVFEDAQQDYYIHSEFKFEFSFDDAREYNEFCIINSEILDWVQQWYLRKYRLQLLYVDRYFHITANHYIPNVQAYKAIFSEGYSPSLAAKVDAFLKNYDPMKVKHYYQKDTLRYDQLGIYGDYASSLLETIRKSSPYPLRILSMPSDCNDWKIVCEFHSPREENPNLFVNYVRDELSKLGFNVCLCVNHK